MKSTAHSNPAKPFRSLINAIFYPYKMTYMCCSMVSLYISCYLRPYNNNFLKLFSWAIAHEKAASVDYKKYSSQHHMNHHVQHCDLHVNPSFPHLGAFPDGIVQCECCGAGVLEIKCPYNAREHSISDAVTEGIIDLQVTTPQGISVKHSHQYLYQIQFQICIVCQLGCFDNKKIAMFKESELSHNFCIELVNKLYCSNVIPELL